MQSVSQWVTLSPLKILFCLFKQRVKAPIFHILFKLFVPDTSLKLFKPFSQFRQFRGRKLRNSRFDFFNIHAKSLAYFLKASNGGRSRLTLELTGRAHNANSIQVDDE